MKHAALALALIACALAFALRGARLPPADFCFCNSAEPTSLDPAVATGLPEGRILRCLYEGLVVKHPQSLAALPGVAQRWQCSADGLAWRFELRPDACWSDGSPLTAEDFRWSWLRLLDARSAAPYAYQFFCVQGARAYHQTLDAQGAPQLEPGSVGVRALDAHTLLVELERPCPYFLELCASPPFFPVQRASLELARALRPENPEIEWTKPGRLVGNGPWVLAERRVNDRIRMTRNAHYWDSAQVAFDSIDALASDSASTALNLYLTGAADWLDQMPPSAVPRLLGRPDFQPHPYLGSYFYRVNVTKPPLDDVRVRRALALAIDRESLTRNITQGGQQPAYALVPPAMQELVPWSSVGFERPAPSALGTGYAADCAAARALLDQVRAERGPLPVLELLYNTQALHKDIAEVVSDGWRRELGLDVRLVNQEWKVYLDTQRSLGYQLSRSVWIADYADPLSFLEIFTSGGENNRTGWSDARYDELLERARLTADAPQRLALLEQAEARLLEELPILPVYFYTTQNLVSPALEGFAENVLDEHSPKFWRWKEAP